MKEREEEEGSQEKQLFNDSLLLWSLEPDRFGFFGSDIDIREYKIPDTDTLADIYIHIYIFVYMYEFVFSLNDSMIPKMTKKYKWGLIFQSNHELYHK